MKSLSRSIDSFSKKNAYLSKNGYLFESSLKIFNPSIANRSERGEFGCFWIFSEISDNV